MNAPAPTRFQEAAAIYAFGARVLYLGPALNLTAHRNAVAVLALGLDEPFESLDEHGWRETEALLIDPDRLHQLRATGRMAFLYVDPLSRDLALLRHPEHWPAILALLRDLADGRVDWRSVRQDLIQSLGGEGCPVDARIKAALSAIHADRADRLSLDTLAGAAGLSASRFRKLFRAATGVTVRRYRLWAAMGAATRAIATGESLTQAALGAGFSSSAHFSAAFREMFGMEPSRLAQGRMILHSPASAASPAAGPG